MADIDHDAKHEEDEHDQRERRNQHQDIDLPDEAGEDEVRLRISLSLRKIVAHVPEYRLTMMYRKKSPQ